MARLGDYIREECHPLGPSGAQKLQLIGVSNERGLHPSSRDTSADLSRYQRVEKNWFAYNPMRVNVGSIGLADDDTKTGFTSPDYTVFSCRAGLDPLYLLYFLKSDYGLEAIARHCSGAVRKRLYYSGLAEIELPIPGLPEQRALVQRIQGISETIRFIREENSDRHELPQLKQAILQAAIEGKLTAAWRAAHPDVEPASKLLQRIEAEKARLTKAKKLRPERPLPRPDRAERPFMIPDTWEWCRYGTICEYVTSGSRGWQQYYSDHGALFIRAQNIKTDKLNLADKAFVSLPTKTEGTRARVLRNDILITITGGNLAKTALIDEDFDEAFVSQHIALTRLVDTNLARWIHQVLTTDGGPRGELLGCSRGDKPGLNLPNVRQLPIPVPPVAEQHAIMTRVKKLMVTCCALEAEIEHSRTHAAELLQVVLKEAFAGSP